MGVKKLLGYFREINIELDKAVGKMGDINTKANDIKNTVESTEPNPLGSPGFGTAPSSDILRLTQRPDVLFPQTAPMFGGNSRVSSGRGSGGGGGGRGVGSSASGGNAGWPNRDDLFNPFNVTHNISIRERQQQRRARLTGNMMSEGGSSSSGVKSINNAVTESGDRIVNAINSVERAITRDSSEIRRRGF